jgi:hypothetical protein
MSKSPINCPDCHTPTEPIRLLDATALGGMSGQGIQHVDLAYAAPDARASFFLHQVPGLGIVRGFICPKCGRILLYGEAHQS